MISTKMKEWAPLTTLLVVVAVTVGGCHVFKQKPVVRPADVQETRQVVRPAATLESLDLRVSDIERRMAAARAANAARARAFPVPR